MKNLYPLIYNNYRTRIIKQEDTIYDYSAYLCGDIMRNINFVPGDGVNTTQLINSMSYKLDSYPDYLVVANMDGSIDSRWFVMDCSRTTNGQYKFVLRRDLITDYFNQIASSDMMITRGKVTGTDPAIFNGEGLKFNQIKTSETLLKDYTGMPWLVAYISPDVAYEHGNISGKIEGFYSSDFENMQSFPLSQYVGKNLWNGSFSGFFANAAFTSKDPAYPSGTINFPLDSDFVNPDSDIRLFSGLPSYKAYYVDSDDVYMTLRSIRNRWEYQRQLNASNIYSQMQSMIPNCQVVSQDTYNMIRNYEGRVVKIGEQLYKIAVTVSNKERIGVTQKGSAIDSAVVGATSGAGGTIGGGADATVILSGSGLLSIALQEIPNATAAFSYAFAGLDISNPETPYGILCMPYRDYVATTSPTSSADNGTMTKENRMKIFQALGTVAGLVYDIQILPYCPIQGLSVEEGDTTIVSKGTSSCTLVPVYSLNPTGEDSKDYYPTSQDDPTPDKSRPNYDNWQKGSIITHFFVAPTANIEFSIYSPITLTDVKQQNETDMWRLCSPNYASTFEFNAAKFYTGDMTPIRYFDVDICCKPYTPYVHVAPRWAGLYGGNFNDARGLICSGEFSVDQISDAWTTYQYNNKNWQAAFNRQIGTMEIQKQFNYQDSIVNGAMGTLGMGVAGLLVGGLIGGGVGLIAGGLQSGYNAWEQNVLSQRGIDDAKAQFQYNNQNIQAQPYSIQKVSAINNNNKLFPILEYYTCTDKEKALFQNYLKYYAMNVRRADKISNYIYDGELNFIQGNLLRNLQIEGSTAIYDAIDQELQKGVYIKR